MSAMPNRIITAQLVFGYLVGPVKTYDWHVILIQCS